MTITDTILELLARPAGVETSQVPGATAQQAGRILQKLAAAGKAFSVRITHRRARYFSTKEQADAFFINHLDKPKRSRAKKPDVELTIPDNVKHTIEKAPPPRFTTVPLLTDKPQPIRSGAYDFRQHQRSGRF